MAIFLFFKDFPNIPTIDFGNLVFSTDCYCMDKVDILLGIFYFLISNSNLYIILFLFKITLNPTLNDPSSISLSII